MWLTTLSLISGPATPAVAKAFAACGRLAVRDLGEGIELMTTSSSTTSQQSQTQPWGPAMGEVSGLLGSLNNLIPGSGVNSAESGAINQLTQNGQAGNPYASAIGNTATNLLNGGWCRI